MNRIHNKHGPDFDVGFPMTGRSRDRTERKPCDGTEGIPRDETALWKGSLVIRYFYRHTEQSQDVRIHGRSSSKWRTFWWSKPDLRTGMGEVCSVENEQ
jgi:hypothetical protein